MDGSKILYALIICNKIIFHLVLSKKVLHPTFEWSSINFSYPSTSQREQDIEDGTFIPGNSIPFDLDIYYTPNNFASKVFLTIPRLSNGVPATLGIVYYVPGADLERNALITPYPSWEWHQNPEECDAVRMVSVFSIYVDQCKRLWILDTGKINARENCPPKLVLINVLHDSFLKSYLFPSHVVNPQSLLLNIVVDSKDCYNSVAYIVDVVTHNLIVYELENDSSNIYSDASFEPNRNFQDFNINGDEFRIRTGITAMALAAKLPANPRAFNKIMLYHSWASVQESIVDTAYLIGQINSPPQFLTSSSRKNTQSGPMAVSDNNIVFYGSFGDTALKCWNVHKAKNFIDSVETLVQNPTNLQFPSGLRIVKNMQGREQLWMMTNRLQKFFLKTLNQNDINFRIGTAYVDTLIRNTKCS